MVDQSISKSDVPSLFVQYLEQQCDPSELEQYYRIVSGVLFVDEQMREKSVALYQQWQKLVTNAETEKSFEKVQRRMFGSELEDVAYVLDGKRCLTGRRATGIEVDAKQSKIKVAQAGLLSAKDYIHPRDPLLESINFARAEMDKHKGLIFVIGSADKRLEVSVLVVQAVVERMRSTSALRKRFPEVKGLLRDSVEPVLQVIKRAKNLRNSEKILVPLDVASLSQVSFLQSGYFYFAVSEGSVVSCFNLHPKSMSGFLHEQLSQLKASSTFPGGFEHAPRNRAHLGKLKVQGRSLTLSVDFFSSFLTEMRKSKKLSEKLPKQFSVLQVLNRMVPILKSSKVISELEVLQTLGHRPHREATYRISGPWIFVIEDKSVFNRAILQLSKEGEHPEKPKTRKRRRPRRRSSKSAVKGEGATQSGGGA